MFTPQEIEGIKRGGYLLIAMLGAGLVAIYPSIISNAPLDVHALERAFAGAALGVVARRYFEAKGDAVRAQLGDVRPHDVGYLAASTATLQSADPVQLAPSAFAQGPIFPPYTITPQPPGTPIAPLPPLNPPASPPDFIAPMGTPPVKPTRGSIPQ